MLRILFLVLLFQIGIAAEVDLTVSQDSEDETSIFSFRCTVQDYEDSEVVSITLYRQVTSRSPRAAPRELVASISSLSPETPTAGGGFEGATLHGEIDIESDTYLEVLFSDLKVEDLGLYVCEVTLLGEDGLITSPTGEARVAAKSDIVRRRRPQVIFGRRPDPPIEPVEGAPDSPSPVSEVAAEEPTTAADDTAVTEEVTIPADEETTAAIEETTVAEEETTFAIEETTVGVEETTVADEVTTVADEETTVVVDETAPAEEETTVAVDETTVVVEETTVAVDETTIVEEETTVAVDETTIVEEETTAAVDETTTITEEETTVAVDETTIIDEETTVAVDETTIIDEETTVAVDETITIAEEETTVAVDETTIIDEETTVAVDETTVIEEETPVAEEETTAAEEEIIVPVDETTVAEEETTVTAEESTTTETPGAETHIEALTLNVENLGAKLDEFNETVAKLERKLASLEQKGIEVTTDSTTLPVDDEVVTDYFVHDNASYFFIKANHPTDVVSAQSVCENRRFYLTEINSQGELQAIADEISPHIVEEGVVIVAGQKEVGENVWFFQGSKEQVDYFSWGPGEPLLTSDNECIALRNTDNGVVMVPYPCAGDNSANFYFLCEHD